MINWAPNRLLAARFARSALAASSSGTRSSRSTYALALATIQAAADLSLSPEETREALLRYGAAAAAFFLASALARTENSVARLAVPIAALAAFEAVYGIFEHYSGREHILLWPKTYPGTVSGTYVNRNHFAGMLALVESWAMRNRPKELA